MAYENMSMAELEAENRKLMAQKAAIQEKQRQVNAAQDQLAAQERAAALAEGLSDPEKAALRQALGPEGIAPESAVGTPGQ